LRGLTLAVRKSRLEKMLAADLGKKGVPVIRFVEHLETAGEAVLQSACRLSLEGIISKKLSAPYRSGRSPDWNKSKCRAGHEVVIGGWSDENGRFRSLLAGVHRGDHLVYIGRVGTGFSTNTVARIFPRIKEQASDRSPFGGANAPRKTRDVHWMKPMLVAEIEFGGWTGDGMVRQAAFKVCARTSPRATFAPISPQRPRLHRSRNDHMTVHGKRERRRTPSWGWLFPNPIRRFGRTAAMASPSQNSTLRAITRRLAHGSWSISGDGRARLFGCRMGLEASSFFSVTP
jgi:hypothetical protein